jgi:hypothetical protein
VVCSEEISPEAMGFSKANFDKVCAFTIFCCSSPCFVARWPRTALLLRDTLAVLGKGKTPGARQRGDVTSAQECDGKEAIFASIRQACSVLLLAHLLKPPQLRVTALGLTGVRTICGHA